MTTPGEDRVRLRAVFAQPGYRRLWAARTASQCGDVFATVALSLLVLDLAGSALGVCQRRGRRRDPAGTTVRAVRRDAGRPVSPGPSHVCRRPAPRCTCRRADLRCGE